MKTGSTSKWVVSNYNWDISWLLDYTDDYVVFDRSDSDAGFRNLDKSKVTKVENIGWDIYDKFNYLVENYDNLPETIILIKGNLFEYMPRTEFDKVKDNQFFTPLLSQEHKTYDRVDINKHQWNRICFYENGMYNEINDRWYLKKCPAKRKMEYDAYWHGIEPDYQSQPYKQFAPGSNYIITRKDVLKRPKDFYIKMRYFVDYTRLPGEAYLIERDLYHIFK